MTTTFCSQCGAQRPAATAFCTSCGVSARKQASQTALATRTVTMPLAQQPATTSQAHTTTPAGAPEGGKLLASGVLSIITGSVYLLLAIMTVSAKDTLFGDMLDDATGVLTLMLLIFLASGVGFLTAGIGACQKKAWAQICTLAVGGVSLVFFLVVLLSTGEASLLVCVGWFGSIVGLAVATKPSTLANLTAARIG